MMLYNIYTDCRDSFETTIVFNVYIAKRNLKFTRRKFPFYAFSAAYGHFNQIYNPDSKPYPIEGLKLGTSFVRYFLRKECSGFNSNSHTKVRIRISVYTTQCEMFSSSEAQYRAETSNEKKVWSCCSASFDVFRGSTVVLFRTIHNWWEARKTRAQFWNFNRNTTKSESSSDVQIRIRNNSHLINAWSILRLIKN